MDVYDLIILFMGYFPTTAPIILGTGAAVTAVVAFSTTFIGGARIVVKLTFWTSNDDDVLAQIEDKYTELTQGPLKPIFKLFDRLSVLKDTV